jgi:hypothetical protein
MRMSSTCSSSDCPSFRTVTWSSAACANVPTLGAAPTWRLLSTRWTYFQLDNTLRTQGNRVCDQAGDPCLIGYATRASYESRIGPINKTNAEKALITKKTPSGTQYVNARLLTRLLALDRPAGLQSAGCHDIVQRSSAHTADSLTKSTFDWEEVDPDHSASSSLCDSVDVDSKNSSAASA